MLSVCWINIRIQHNWNSPGYLLETRDLDFFRRLSFLIGSDVHLSLKPSNFIQPALPGQIMLAKYMKHRISLEQASHATGVSKCRYEPVPRVTNRDICERALYVKNKPVADGSLVAL